jgi:hypothetical protein
MARTAIAALVAALGVLAVASTAAWAGTRYGQVGGFGKEGAGNGEFATPVGVAVDQSSGDVYVVDSANARVQKFEAGGAYVSQFAGGETPASAFSSPSAVAVDNSSSPFDTSAGDVYVVDAGNSAVDKFTPAGVYVGQLTATAVGGFSELQGVAVDGNGNVWVSQASGEVAEFTSEGAFVTSWNTNQGAGPGLTVTASDTVYATVGWGGVYRYSASGNELANSTPGNETALLDGGYATGIAVDPSSGNVFVDDGFQVNEYEPLGNPLPPSFGSGVLSAGKGVSFDDADGQLYVADGEANRVDIFGLVTVADASTQPASSLSSEGATLNGTVNPNGIDATCRFEYGTEESYGSTVACEPEDVGSGEAEEAVHATLIGLEPNTTYHYRVLATDANGATYGQDRTLTTYGPPRIDSHSDLYEKGQDARVEAVGTEGATFTGLVNQMGQHATYRFEYGTTSAYGASIPVPDGDLGSGTSDVSVSQTVDGLQPNTTYHYRIVATGEHGVATGEDHVFTTYPLQVAQADTCPNAERRAEQRAAYLPDCRAYEMVSPQQKDGQEVTSDSTRTRASTGESTGLPAAVEFMSLGGFGDAHGVPLLSEYLSERTGLSGSTGWATHAITPAQESLTFIADAKTLEPGYEGEMSNDLTKGTFTAWSPLTNAPNVAHVPSNIYVREDLRSAGEGSYRLLTDALAPIPPRDPESLTVYPERQMVAGATQDFQHVLFESDLNLTSDATGSYRKLYKADGGNVRLVSAGPDCPGEPLGFGSGPFGSPHIFTPGQCSLAGVANGSSPFYAPRVLSSDGSRVEFTYPTEATIASLTLNSGVGARSRLFQLDDRGTTTVADDALIQLDTSEKAVPDTTQLAWYQTASEDGSRVFFTSNEQLTEAPGGGLYMWARQPGDDQQSVTVDATGGVFTLTFHSQITHGTGTITAGSHVVKSLQGSFAPGQTLTVAGFPAGTTVTEVARNGSMTLSAAATESGSRTFAASIDATTPPLSFDASATQVQAALEALPGIGQGNVTVTGGPGGAAPYIVTFTGGLKGVDVAQLSTDGSGLTGGGANVIATVTKGVHDLTLVAPISVSIETGVIGASRDGHRVYFMAENEQLVPGGPQLPPRSAAIYYWQDAEGPPSGTISFVGGIAGADRRPNLVDDTIGTPGTSRVTPDGRFLLFESSAGQGLSPKYDQSACDGRGGPLYNSSGGCAEVYVYRAEGSTPSEPNLACASCNPSGAPATQRAWVNARVATGKALVLRHLSHAISDDGKFVFFWTAESLVPQDTNGRADVYEYDVASHTVHLISGGVGSSDSYFLDAAANGDNVYFSTSQQLLRWDIDHSNDVYDARVNGGFPEPMVGAECVGEACHGPASSMPVFTAPASTSIAGFGNAGRPVSKAVSRHSGQRRLAGALRACRRLRSRGRRRHCEKHARERFGRATGTRRAR